ncbi:MAG: putative P-loop NTPase [Firmicutes bacterium]|nr:putative P-loop NTPase [Bacillota bacterium]
MERKNENLFEINYTLLFKLLLLGALLGEFLIIGRTIGQIFVEYSVINQKENWLWVIGLSYFLMTLVCFFKQNFFKRICLFFKSMRFDLMLLLVFGAIVVFAFDGLGINYLRIWIKSISWLQLTMLVSLPVVVFFSLVLRALQVRFSKKKTQDSFFISDKEGKEKSDDKFAFADQAEKFAERVFNQGSSESLVFGIDAPWGTGKSTFVNLCKEYWKKKHKKEMIIYSFDPLRYENRENLLKIFVEGLITSIQDQVFAPEIDLLVSRYAKLLKDSKVTISFLGINLSLPLINKSIDDIFESLEIALLNIDKKIVVIVDDLDRLDFTAIKEVLFVIKKAFMLPNISYVICYDTENIAALEHKNVDTEKIIEFLEKFINVKTSLYLDNKLLLEYFTINKDETLSKNLLANPELVSKAVEGLKDIFNSNEFHCYLPFVGDARKLKRLINTILLLEVEKTDFDNYDFDKKDIIHLLLIYINYPNIFRKIYNTETQGKKGFFSVVSQYEDGYLDNDSSNKDSTYKNSSYYTQYLEKLTENQKFILNKVFQRLNGSGTNEELASYACFNGSRWGGGSRNLEAYINLITKMSRSPKTQQYKFYINCKNMILSDTSIVEVLSGKEFSDTEINHQSLWRVLVNSQNEEVAPEKAKEIIYYALNNLPQYSILKVDDIVVGLRHDLSFYIAKLLDKVGWLDERSGYRNNTDENIIQIAKWIFGDDKYKGRGILDILGSKERGILGLYDLLLFRLVCCADRGGDIFNLSRALSKYDNAQAPIEGDTRTIVIDEMRKMSQKVFQTFKSQFIDEKKNIFDEIDNLAIEDAAGKYFELLRSKVNSQTLEKINLQTKSSMKAFITYQLGSTIISSGIGCGYYDSNGNKDEKGISYLINEYLFNCCFNPQISQNNYRHFIDYLLINLSNTMGGLYGSEYVPNINDFTKILERDRISAYWQEYGHLIKSNKFEEENRIIYTSSYELAYINYVKKIYKTLDKLQITNNND